jgi:hypothetical protein
MKVNTAFKGLGATLLLYIFLVPAVQAAPACKGPNKNDPGCPGAEEPPPEPALPGAVVDSVTVDWFNQVLVVRGLGLSGITSWGLAGFAGPLSVAGGATDTELQIEFDADLASEVAGHGSYILNGDGTGQLSVFIESQIIDPGATGCPCTGSWSGTVPNWGAPQTECVEIEGPGANDAADISGEVLTDPLDPLVYPHFLVGASFYPGEPDDSVCRLVQLDGDLAVTDLENVRINETQQADCRTVLAANACSPITTVP